MIETIAAAISMLSSTNVVDRLNAARFLKVHAGRAEVDQLRAASQFETDALVSTALRSALERSTGAVAPKPVPQPDERADALAEVRREAIRNTTRMLLHELRPLVGQLEVTVQPWVDSYWESDVATEVDGIRQTLMAFEDLYSATDAPQREEFDLTDLVLEVARAETARSDPAELSPAAAEAVYREDEPRLGHSPVVEVFLAGDEPVMTVGAPRLLRLILSNAIRNAIEACAGGSTSRSSVVVSWGATDVDAWVSVVDDGPGLPPELPEPFAAGSTGKSVSEHRGMGLVVVAEAASSIRARVTLQNRDGRGCRFEARWSLAEDVA